MDNEAEIPKTTSAPVAGRYRISLAVAIIFTVFSYVLMHTAGDYKDSMKVIVADVVSYYNYLPAVFKYQNLKFEELPLRIGTITAADGTVVEKMSMGLAFLYLPFYLIAVLYIKITGLPYEVYSAPFAYMLNLSAIVYFLAGLLFLRRVMMRYFSDLVIAMGMATVFLGTNFLFYTAYSGPLTHVYNFALISLFL
jgi:hypothetical protein